VRFPGAFEHNIAQGHAALAGTCGLSLMSRLRRVELHSRSFFITCNLKRGIQPLCDSEIEVLAKALRSVRRKVPFALCGYCFMPDHWHAILLPEACTSISDILMRIKIAAYRRISSARECPRPIWQSRFYDHILHSRAEFDQTLDYVHQNPVVKGLVHDSSNWKWSSAAWYANRTGPIEIDEFRLTLNSLDRI
jgi:putative transposase